MMFHDWSNIGLIRRNCVGTVFPLKDEDGGNLPFLVDKVSEDRTFSGRVFTGKKINRMRVEEDQLSIDKIRLGYIHDGGGVSYLMRRPAREFRQGLRPSNIVGLPHGCARTLDCFLVALYLPMSGDYPEFEEAKYLMNLYGSKAVSFDRNFSIDRSGLLYHKGLCVGVYNKSYGIDREELSLNRKYMYLSEALARAMGEREYLLENDPLPEPDYEEEMF